MPIGCILSIAGARSTFSLRIRSSLTLSRKDVMNASKVIIKIHSTGIQTFVQI